jgi:tetratricopeptide (TPR) repeat protein
MTGWSSRAGDDWGDEPAWVYEITWEWEPVPGQRYPGDPGRRKAVHTPVYEAKRDDRGVGRASVGQSPTPPPAWSSSEDQVPRRFPHRPVQHDEPPTYDPRQPQGRENLNRPGGRSAPVPPQRDEPAWNRPAAMPDRVPGDEPGWNRAASMQDRVPGEERRPQAPGDERRPQPPGDRGRPDQRRGAAPVYGRPDSARPDSARPESGRPDQTPQQPENRPHAARQEQYEARPPAARQDQAPQQFEGRPPAARPEQYEGRPHPARQEQTPPQQFEGRQAPRPAGAPPAFPAGNRATPQGQPAGNRAAAQGQEGRPSAAPTSPDTGRPGVYGASRPAAAGYYGRRPEAADAAGVYGSARPAPADAFPARPAPADAVPARPAPAEAFPARPAPAEAFPARPEVRPAPGQRSEAPFDLRPMPPDRGTPATARPAPQPTRITPPRSDAAPAPLFPAMPDRPDQVELPIVAPHPSVAGASPAPVSAPTGEPQYAPRPVSTPAAEPTHAQRPAAEAAYGTRPVSPRAAEPVYGSHPTSGPAQPAAYAPQQVSPSAYGPQPVSGYGPPPAQQPVAGPAGPSDYPQRPVSAPGQYTEHSGRPVSAPAQPAGYTAQPVSAPSQPTAWPVSAPAQPTEYSAQPVSAPGQHEYTAQPVSAPSQPSPYTAQPVSAPTQPTDYPAQPVSAPGRPTGYTPQPVSAPGQPTAYSAQPVSMPPPPTDYPPRPVSASHEVVTPHSVSGPAHPVSGPTRPVSGPLQAAEPAAATGWGSGFEAIEPVTAPPFATPPGDAEAEVFDPSVGPVAASAVESATMPEPASIEPDPAAPTAEGGHGWTAQVWEQAPAAEPEPAADEPHGLGWLLSQSGFAGSTPALSDTDTDTDTVAEPEPVAEARPVSALPETPVSAAPEKQDWFAPVSGIPSDVPEDTEPAAQPDGEVVVGTEQEPEPQPVPHGRHESPDLPTADAQFQAEAQPEPEYVQAEHVQAEPEYVQAEHAEAEPDDAQAQPEDIDAHVKYAGPDSDAEPELEAEDQPAESSELLSDGAGSSWQDEAVAENVDAPWADVELPAEDVAAEEHKPEPVAVETVDVVEDGVEPLDEEIVDAVVIESAADADAAAAIEAPPRLPELAAEPEPDEPESEPAPESQVAEIEPEPAAEAETAEPEVEHDEPQLADDESDQEQDEPELAQDEAEAAGEPHAATEAQAPAEPEAAEPEAAEPEATTEPDAADEPETAEPETADEPETIAVAETAEQAQQEPEPEPDAQLKPDAQLEPDPQPESEAAAPQPATPQPAAPIRQQRDQRTPAPNRRADPEQVLSTYPWVFDPETLRERIDDPDQMWVVIDRLTDKLEYAERDSVRARLLSLRAVAQRLAGDLDPALADAREALEHAKTAAEPQLLAITRARLAHVLHWRGEYAEADRRYAEAASPELPARLRAEIHELAGRSAFDQGRYLEAVNHFESALDLRRGADPELVERIELALDTITRHTSDGWGPYPRTREEILGHTDAARPLQDDRSGLWGYVGAVPPRFAQAQPFAESLAWVRRPDSPTWELIDEAGEVVIDASSGYRAAGPFAEGLAWVSRDSEGGWYAIDRQNRVIVPGGFDAAMPFHNGLALILRGGWGAVDQHGRIVVQPRYRAFATATVDGGPMDGFTDDGLAVVDAGERFGVIDRQGQLIVPPAHAALLIHPSGFLISDKFGLWGALDRSGATLVEMKYSDRGDVIDEIDKLVTDTRPVL